jgi:CHAD domain-containing protein
VRYAGEFFADLVPRKQMKVFLGELAELQQALGSLNDIAVAGARLNDTPTEGGQARAAGLVAGWHQIRRAPLLAEAQKSWKHIQALGLPWNED